MPKTNRILGKINQGVVLALTVIVAAAAVFVYQKQEKTSTGSFKPRKLFKSVDIGKVSAVEIAAKEENVKVEKTGEDAWGVASRSAYPVDNEKLRRLVISVAGLEAADKLTENAANYEKLGVGEKPETARIKLIDASGGALADVIVGKEREGRPAEEGGFAPATGQYIRVEGDPAVYLIKDALRIETAPTQWLQKEIVKVEENNLQEIRVANAATTESFSLARSGVEPFKVTSPIPAGLREKSGSASSVARALANLTLTDVLATSDAKASEIQFKSTYEAIQKNGLVYVAKGGELGEDRFVKLEARYEPGMDLSKIDDRTSDTVTAKSLELAEVTMKKVNDRHANWIYQIPSWSYESVAKLFSALIEPVPTPTPIPDPNAPPRPGPGAGLNGGLPPGLEGLNLTPPN